MRKIIVRGVLGGLALFAWSFIAHLPPIGTAGERSVTPAEGDTILRIMNGPMHERAVYILPGFDAKHQDAWLKKLEAGPAAIVVYNPHPADQAIAGSPYATWMLRELLFDILAAVIGATIAAHLAPALGFWRRVFLLAAIGLLATLDIEGGYWNWYAFPTSYLLAQFVDHVGGWFVAGLALSAGTSARSNMP